MTAELHTARLVLRKPQAEDWPALRAFQMSKRAEFVGGPRTEGEAWRLFAAEVGHWDILGFGMWTATLRATGEAIGLVGPWCPADWPEKEVGWFVYDGFEGQGLAAEAARATIAHVFGTLGWDTAVSYIDPANTRSIALAERLGAWHDPEAKAPGSYGDSLVYRHPNPVEGG